MNAHPLPTPTATAPLASPPASLQYQRYFFVGCKGVGMTALAQCLLDMGKQVSGWDVAETFVTDALLDQRQIQVSDTLTLPSNAQVVVYSAAHQDIQHPLVQQALAQNLPIFSLAQITADLTHQKPSIAVCGVGGKSTTSALLAWIFWHTPKKASFLVGVGGITGLPVTGYWSESSSHFVVEADEYAANPSAVAQGQPVQPRFQDMSPSICICTQILHDHPDVYPTLADTKQAFMAYFSQLNPNGTLIYNADDVVSVEVVNQVAQSRPDVLCLSIGTAPASNVHLTAPVATLGQTRCQAVLDDATAATLSLAAPTVPIELTIPGSFNLWNATAALVAALCAGVPLTTGLASIATFRSTKRRLEQRQIQGNQIWYDDYAHHPSEIRQTLESLRDWYPDRALIVAFEPHTFSRTAAFLDAFAHSLTLADHVVLLPIFASARESTSTTVTAADLAERIAALGTAVQLVDSYAQAAALLQAQPATTIRVTMGAGSIAKVYQHLDFQEDS